MAVRNTALSGDQILAAVCGNGLEKDGSDNIQLDLKSSGGLKIDTGEVAVEPNDFAGDGLADDGSDNLKLDLNELTGAAVDVAADSIAIVDVNDSNASRKEAVADVVTAIAGVGLVAASGVLALDLNELAAAAVAVADDSIVIVDATDNSSKKESIADLATAMAGTGITALNGVLSSDTVANNVIEADIKKEVEVTNGAETVFNLAETPIANSVQVFLGLLQEEGSGKDYVLSVGAKTVTFATAPATANVLQIHYIQDN